jgi:hypothetical protein
VPVDRIEALVDALIALLGSSDPEGDLYPIRNPTGLTSFSLPGKGEIDSQGRRIFKSWAAGYHAACYDAQIKVSGSSRSGIKKDDKLGNFLRVMKVDPSFGQPQVLQFLRHALKDQSITVETPLSYFRES